MKNATPQDTRWVWESFVRRWGWLQGGVGDESAHPLPRGYARPALLGGGADPATRLRAEAAWLKGLDARRQNRENDRRALSQDMDGYWLLHHPQWTGLLNPGLGASLEGLWHGASARPWVGIWPSPAPAEAARPVEFQSGKEEFALAVEEPAGWLFPRQGPLVGAMDCWLPAHGALPPGPPELAGFHGGVEGELVILSGLASYTTIAAASLHTPDTALLGFEHATAGGTLQKTWAFGPHALGLHQSLTAQVRQDTWVGQWWFLPCFEKPARGGRRGPAPSFKVRRVHREVSLPVCCQGRLSLCVGWVLSNPALGVSLVVDVDPPVWLVFFPCFSMLGRGEKIRPVFQGVGVYACQRASAGKTIHQSWKITQVGV